MSEEKELKLACLHQAGGDLDHAQRLFDWVSGSVRATPDSEAAEVSAPKQDKPQQSFNYRHPSKYGTDVPRRCYLEELTPEERAIRDLVDTVERLGAHPLLTATVIQLMKAGEDLADWVDIGLRDKDIAALSPGSDLGLLDENPAAGDTEVRNQAEDEAPLDVQAAGLENDPLAAALLQEAMDSGHADGPRVGQFVRHDWVDGTSPGYGNITTCKLCGRVKRASNEFGPCPEANRSEFVEPSTDAERLSVVTDQDRVEQADLLLENQPGVSSQASSTEAAPANIPTNEGQNPWEPIRYCVDGMVIKRDTEFMCSDGVIRQRRIDGEVGFLELRMETFNEFEGEKTLAYRFTHSRDWKPAIDWAPYFGLTPPTHYGYRLETRWHEGGNQYRYVPTDQFIAHEGDWQDISKLDREELNDALLEGTAGRLGFGDGVGAGVMADAVLVSADTREAGVVAADISDAERTEVASEPLATTEQTLITDDIPSIPREEIPIGSAVETYTDSGIETVKISGTTYVVDDEPVAEASYAPINSEPASDALMWANGFEADAKAKAEPEQEKRPFWVFGKAKVDA